MKKRIFITFFSILLLIFFEGTLLPESTKNLQYTKQPELQQIKPNKPVKIKLKRSVEGKYSWDLSGDNVDDIVKVDKRLKKLLKIE